MLLMIKKYDMNTPSQKPEIKIPDQFDSSEQVIEFIGDVSARVSEAITVMESMYFWRQNEIDEEIQTYIKKLCELSDKNLSDVLDNKSLRRLSWDLDFFSRSLENVGLMGIVPTLFPRWSQKGDSHNIQKLLEYITKSENWIN